MPTELVSPGGTSVIHHDGEVYRPDKRGVFSVPDNAVNALRPHGLVPLAEARAAAKTAQQQDDAANDAAHIAELEAKLAAALTAVEDREASLDAARKRIAELEAQVAGAKGEGK